jgi:hypothetical protein
MKKPIPILWIPSNAEARNPASWHKPNSLCRTCIFQFLQEPFCETVEKLKRKAGGIAECDGYERETKTDETLSAPSYT